VKHLFWLGDSLENVRAFPSAVRDRVGFALYVAQEGGVHASAKPLHGLGGGVMEIAARDEGGAYRAVYTVSIGAAIYVLHAFQKKSKRGIATPRADMELVRNRLRQLQREVRDGANEAE
jgi:phage-related protein